MALYFGDDLALCAISLFAFSVCPWGQIATKMAAFAFVWWALVCLSVNAIIEYFDTTRPYEMAALFVISAVLVAFGCLRFLIFKTPDVPAVDDDHLYLIVSSPRSLTGIWAMIITGMGGGFTVWHPGTCGLYKYVKGDGPSIFTRIHQADAPNHKMIIDMGPATKSRLDYLDSQIGAQWSYFNNCLTKIGAVKYDR